MVSEGVVHHGWKVWGQEGTVLDSGYVVTRSSSRGRLVGRVLSWNQKKVVTAASQIPQPSHSE